MNTKDEHIERLKEESDFRRGEEAGRDAGMLDIVIDAIGNAFESDAYKAGYSHGVSHPNK